MAKKKIPDLYEGLPTTLPEVETQIQTKLTRRDELRAELVRVSSELTATERDIKHLERQSRFILGVEVPSDIELEQEKDRRDRRDKKGKYAEKKKDTEPVPPAGTMSEEKPDDTFGKTDSPRVTVKDSRKQK